MTRPSRERLRARTLPHPIRIVLALLIIYDHAAAVPAQRKAPTRPSCGPPIELVVAAALERAGLEPKEEPSFRRRLAWSALLPRLTGRVNQSSATGEIVDPRYALSSSTIKNYLAQQWEIRATWDLSRLIFDTRELRVAGRAQRSAARRQQLLEQVVQLYFERCRLLLSVGMPERDPEQDLLQALEVQRITALLDGLSGGLFTGARWR